MDGNKAYKNQFARRIDGLVMANPSENYLRGFSNFLSKSSESTVYNYMNYALGFMKAVNKKPEELTLDDYTAYLASLTNETASYQIAVYSALKKFSIYLVASKRNLENHMQYIERPKFRETQETKTKREKGSLNSKEISIYLSSVDKGIGSQKAIARQREWKERDIAITQVFLNTGMRCSALYKLDVANVDFEQKNIMVMDKGGKIQSYNLNDDTLNKIALWLDKRKQLLNNEEETALFISNQRKRMDQSSIGRVVHKYAENIEGKNITPHKLRATYGTQLYEQTRDIYFVQECMGHNNPKTTELYIRGQKEGNRKRAADIMSKIINKQ